MPDDGLNTLIAGVRCRAVLAELSEYIDGALSANRVATLQAHLNGCDPVSVLEPT
jgi:anti-sigma factor RsiW